MRKEILVQLFGGIAILVIVWFWQYARPSYNYYIFFSKTQLRKSPIVVSMLLRNKHLARVESFQNRNYPFALQNACCKEVPYYFSNGY